MNPFTEHSIRDPHDRLVRRARLIVGSGAPRHRLAFALEEALRLSSLPGEEQGRSYYFRQLRVAGLSSTGDRRVWLDTFERALVRKAERSVHGADPRASLAEGIYFHSELEALEILLHRMLAQRTAHEWFWPMVIGRSGQPASTRTSILDLVLRLSEQPASWVAVAFALFAKPGFDVVRLLESIPAERAERWIEEMDRPLTQSFTVDSRPTQPAIRRALRSFGNQHPGVLWLATLAVLLDAPSDLAAGTAVVGARAGLRRLATEHGIESGGTGYNAEFETAIPAPALTERSEATTAPKPRRPDILASGAHSSNVAQSWFDHPAQAGNSPLPAHARVDSGMRATPPSGDAPQSVQLLSLPPKVHPRRQWSTAASHDRSQDAATDAAGGTSEREDSPSDIASPALAAATGLAGIAADRHRHSPDGDVSSAPLPWLVFGLSTQAAGLFFLLNAMQRIGIAEALSSGLSGLNFAPRVLQSLAAQARVAPDDPALHWLASLIPDCKFSSPTQVFDAGCWPNNLAVSGRKSTLEDVVRIWTIAVRRWCWRRAGVSSAEIISRAGVFSVNRTDLDLSLSIDAADVRVRKAGLDLNPGWLPWIGRVVRFHYVFRGEIHG